MDGEVPCIPGLPQTGLGTGGPDSELGDGCTETAGRDPHRREAIVTPKRDASVGGYGEISLRQ